MSLQENVSVSVVYGAEATLGVPASAGGTAKTIRRMGTSLNAAKDTYASNEVRQDQQVADMRHGTKRGAGTIDGELSTESYDDFIEAAMRGTWAEGATAINPANNTSVAFASTGVITFGSGSLLTQGVRVGHVLRPSGITGANAGLNGKNLRVTAVTATTMTVALPKGVTMANQTAQTTGFAFAAPGKLLTMGKLKRSFTIEQHYPDIDGSELFEGSRIGGFGLSIQPNGMITVGFDVLAKRPKVLEGSEAPYFTDPNDQGSTGVLSSMSGRLRMLGGDQVVVTALSLNLSCGLTAPPVVGDDEPADIFYGRSVVTGSVSTFMANMDMVKAFHNEDELSLGALCTSADQADFINFVANRIKLGAAQKTVAAEGGLIVTSPFQALLKSGTGFDTSTLVIQRSNA